jgi:uncharacterized membrane protein
MVYTVNCENARVEGCWYEEQSEHQVYMWALIRILWACACGMLQVVECYSTVKHTFICGFVLFSCYSSMIKNGNTMRQHVSYLYMSRKPTIHLGGRCCTILSWSLGYP